MSDKNFMSYGDAEPLFAELGSELGKRVEQYSTMPSASSTLLNKIVQYIGITSESYINGLFYKCVYNEIEADYEWIKIDMGGDSGIAITATLLASGWDANNQQTIIFDGYSSSMNGVIGVPTSATSAQKTAYAEAIINVVNQVEDSFTFEAVNVPSVDLPVVVYAGGGSGSSGTTVIANPEGAATANLSKLQVDDTIYQIVGGGGSGGGFEQTVLWDYETDNGGSVLFGLVTATLHDAVENYDAILIDVVSVSSDMTDANWKSTFQFHIDVNALSESFNPNYILCESAADRTSRYYIQGTTLQKTSQSATNTNGLVRVYGLKFGGGSGSGSDYSFTNLWTGSQSAVGEITLNDNIENYDLIQFICQISNGGCSVDTFDTTYFLTEFPYKANPTANDKHYCPSAWDNAYARVITGSSTDKLYTWDFYNSQRITAVNGIKLGSGSGGGTGGASAISDLTDVELTNLSDGQILQYNAESEKWNNSNALNNKVDKVSGKELSTNDYTTAEKELVATIPDKADSITVEGSTSVSGNPIAISDAANAYAEEVIANIEPIQDLHGYDKPWVGGAGKNLLPMTVEGIKAANTSGSWLGNTYTFGGVTFTIQTDSNNNVTGIKVNGTASVRVVLYLIDTPNTDSLVISGDLYISFKKEGINSVGINRDGTWFSSKNDFSFSVSTSIEDMWIDISANTVIDTVLTPQLEFGMSATSFAPYSNICPISGLDSVEVKRTGKNLFNPSAIISGKIIDGEVVTISSTNDWISGYKTPVNVTSLYVKILDNKDTYTGSFYAACWDEKGDYLGFSNVISFNDISIPYVGMLTLQTGTKYFMLLGYNANGGVTKIKSVVAIISVADVPYEPYTAETHTTSLPQTVYGGTLNVQTGELVVDRAKDSFTVGTGAYIRNLSAEPKYIKGQTINGVISDSMLPSYNTDESTHFYFDTKSRISIFNYTGASLTFEVCYELATPQTYQLTPSQVKLLLNYNNISTNADTLDLTYQVNNILGEILGESEEYADRISKSEIFEITPGDDTTSRTFTFSKKPKKVTISWYEGTTSSSWASTWSFLWGDRRAYGIGGNTDNSSSGQYPKVSAITYGADGKSFTITGANAGNAANTSGSDHSGRLFVEY